LAGDSCINLGYVKLGSYTVNSCENTFCPFLLITLLSSVSAVNLCTNLICSVTSNYLCS